MSITLESQSRCDELAEEYGIDLRLEYDGDAPMPYAIWSDDEIVGAGTTELSALRDAEEQLAAWSEA
ncbi:MAG TPA: hypothetical protein VGK73_01680 [Polyangiaceae bacterium]